MKRRITRTAALMGWVVALAACTSTPGETGTTRREVSGPAEVRGADLWQRLAWGTGASAVGLLPRATDQLAEGPSAVSVAPDGAALVLDRIRGRVVRVDGNGAREITQVPADAEDLAAGAGGDLVAAYSPLRARVWLRADGRPAGEVAVPRVLRLARGISLARSRQVLLHNAHQETYRLGSPATARMLPAVLHSKREGAAFLPDGTGVAVRRRADGRAEVLLLASAERTLVKRRLSLPDKVMGVRLVGVAEGLACLRLEKRGPSTGTAIDVTREAVCLRLVDGQIRWRRSLPAPGLYLPRRELALGGHPLRLAFIHPESAGLVVQTWVLPAADDRRAR